MKKIMKVKDVKLQFSGYNGPYYVMHDKIYLSYIFIEFECGCIKMIDAKHLKVEDVCGIDGMGETQTVIPLSLTRFKSKYGDNGCDECKDEWK